MVCKLVEYFNNSDLLSRLVLQASILSTAISVKCDSERNEYLIGNRIRKTGRPFEFLITKKGEKLINKFTKRF
ncbi:MAG: hypothetical protein KKI14_02455 [Nanoarchaeota archaeon]|nr:hypothetical protein [Nanoarchaeota archaeon]